MAIRINFCGLSIYKPGFYGPMQDCPECKKSNCYLMDQDHLCWNCGYKIYDHSILIEATKKANPDWDGK